MAGEQFAEALPQLGTLSTGDLGVRGSCCTVGRLLRRTRTCALAFVSLHDKLLTARSLACKLALMSLR